MLYKYILYSFFSFPSWKVILKLHIDYFARSAILRAPMQRYERVGGKGERNKITHCCSAYRTHNLCRVWRSTFYYYSVYSMWEGVVQQGKCRCPCKVVARYFHMYRARITIKIFYKFHLDIREKKIRRAMNCYKHWYNVGKIVVYTKY